MCEGGEWFVRSRLLDASAGPEAVSRARACCGLSDFRGCFLQREVLVLSIRGWGSCREPLVPEYPWCNTVVVMGYRGCSRWRPGSSRREVIHRQGRDVPIAVCISSYPESRISHFVLRILLRASESMRPRSHAFRLQQFPCIIQHVGNL
jgi:hypothetical protein